MPHLVHVRHKYLYSTRGDWPSLRLRRRIVITAYPCLPPGGLKMMMAFRPSLEARRRAKSHTVRVLVFELYPSCPLTHELCLLIWDAV